MHLSKFGLATAVFCKHGGTACNPSALGSLGRRIVGSRPAWGTQRDSALIRGAKRGARKELLSLVEAKSLSQYHSCSKSWLTLSAFAIAFVCLFVCLRQKLKLTWNSFYSPG